MRRFELVAQLPDDADARKVEQAQEFDLDMALVPGLEDRP